MTDDILSVAPRAKAVGLAAKKLAQIASSLATKSHQFDDLMAYKEGKLESIVVKIKGRKRGESRVTVIEHVIKGGNVDTLVDMKLRELRDDIVEFERQIGELRELL